jgi:hypothetical protein
LFASRDRMSLRHAHDKTAQAFVTAGNIRRVLLAE